MIFAVNFSFVSDISMIGNLSNLEFCSLMKRFSGLTMYNFSKDSNSTRFGQKKFFCKLLVLVGRRGC